MKICHEVSGLLAMYSYLKKKVVGLAWNRTVISGVIVRVTNHCAVGTYALNVFLSTVVVISILHL